jgi:hypothetical protein
MLIYTHSCVAVPSSLFTVRTVIGVILVPLAFLGLTSTFGFHISLKYCLHEDHLLVPPNFL